MRNRNTGEYHPAKSSWAGQILRNLRYKYTSQEVSGGTPSPQIFDFLLDVKLGGEGVGGERNPLTLRWQTRFHAVLANQFNKLNHQNKLDQGGAPYPPDDSTRGEGKGVTPDD